MKPTDNINLPAALLSRFDLLFLLLDKPNIQDDLRLAQHVTFVHKSLRHPTNDGDTELIPMSTIKYFISKAREFQPTLPSAVGDYVVNAYVHLRQHASETSEFQYTSARTLLSVVRLGTALVLSTKTGAIEVCPPRARVGYRRSAPLNRNV